MITFTLRQSAHDESVWGVLMHNSDGSLIGTVTFQGTRAQEWAANYFTLQTALNEGETVLLHSSEGIQE